MSMVHARLHTADYDGKEVGYRRSTQRFTHAVIARKAVIYLHHHRPPAQQIEPFVFAWSGTEQGAKRAAARAVHGGLNLLAIVPAVAHKLPGE